MQSDRVVAAKLLAIQQIIFLSTAAQIDGEITDEMEQKAIDVLYPFYEGDPDFCASMLVQFYSTGHSPCPLHHPIPLQLREVVSILEVCGPGGIVVSISKKSGGEKGWLN
ncbi:hypothetical protein KKE14_00220 [Patescibacteria group bacterium]|nr:hypothetical protein [Patescibacteria group bacterium]